MKRDRPIRSHHFCKQRKICKNAVSHWLFRKKSDSIRFRFVSLFDTDRDIDCFSMCFDFRSPEVGTSQNSDNNIFNYNVYTRSMNIEKDL